MKHIIKMLIAITVMLFVISPVTSSSAKEESFYFSDETKKDYKQQESIVISKNMHFTSWYNSDVYPNVKEVIFEEGTISLDSYVFYCFPNVKKIILPNSMEDADYAFCTDVQYYGNEKQYILKELENIEVGLENLFYCSIDGVLYSKDETQLICYPSHKSSTIYRMPTLVKEIHRDAFGYNTILNEIEFGASMGSQYGVYMKNYGYLPNVTTYSLNKSNHYLSLYDGCLYDYDKTKLMSVPYGEDRKKLVLPETVTQLADSCFSYAKIDELVLAPNIEGNPMCSYAFENNQIASISVTNGKEISTVDGVLYNKTQTELICWPARKSVEELTFPSTLEHIPLYIPHVETTKKIVIPKKCTYTNLNLQGDNSLESIEVEKGNEALTVKDGILYTKDFNYSCLIPTKSTQTTITIPKGYSSISMDCSSTMPSVTKIIIEGDCQYFPFYLFPNVEQFVVADGNKKVKVIDGVLYSNDGKKLLYYPKTKKDKKFTVPSKVTSFGDYAFYAQDNLETLILSSNLNLSEDRDSHWFIHCRKLKSIQVPSKSRYLSSSNGVLFDKKKTKLICYPSGKTDKSYKVPNSVKVFCVYGANTYLTSLQLGSAFKDFMYYDIDSRWDMFEFSKLSSITVSKKNKNFTAMDGILYEKKKKNLLLRVYPFDKKDESYTFGKNVFLSISDWSDYTRLKTIKSLNPKVSIFDKYVNYGTYVEE